MSVMKQRGVLEMVFLWNAAFRVSDTLREHIHEQSLLLLGGFPPHRLYFTKCKSLHSCLLSSAKPGSPWVSFTEIKTTLPELHHKKQPKTDCSNQGQVNGSKLKPGESFYFEKGFQWRSIETHWLMSVPSRLIRRLSMKQPLHCQHGARANGR